ncbi:MAG: ferric reductase-like transmembrane domain-containing protein [Chloroflexi bacterium]|nr:ferric reductase-like transmembrane domain-containing protein [Chloroflexota bacterium]
MNHEFWYLSRAAGFTAYALLFVSVALGISIGTRLTERFARRNTIFDMHRFTTILALLFTLFHVYVLLADGYFRFNAWQLSIPFLSPYRGWQTAAGVLSLYALTLLIASFYARKYIGYRAWRVLHFLTFALFAAATLHGITAGTDTTQAWAKALYLVCGAGTVALIMYRVQYRVPDSSAVRTLRLAAAIGTGATALLLAFGTGLFTAANPSSAAGASAVAAPLAEATPPPAAFPFLASFDDDFSGTFVQSQDATTSHLTLNGTTSGDLAANVRIELTSEQAVPTPDNEDGERDVNDDEDAEKRPRASVTLNKAQLLDPASNSVICDGRLTRLDDGYMRLTCDGAGPYAGVRITVASRVRTNADGSFTGALSGQMHRTS